MPNTYVCDDVDCQEVFDLPGGFVDGEGCPSCGSESISEFDDSQDDFDDSMDGDFDSGMASAGWGTDEDYG